MRRVSASRKEQGPAVRGRRLGVITQTFRGKARDNHKKAMELCSLIWLCIPLLPKYESNSPSYFATPPGLYGAHRADRGQRRRKHLIGGTPFGSGALSRGESAGRHAAQSVATDAPGADADSWRQRSFALGHGS